MSLSWSGGRGSRGLYQLWLLYFPILFLCFMLIGLYCLFAEGSPHHKNTDRRRATHSWAATKRVAFGLTGVLLLGLGLSTIVRSLIQLIQRQGADPYLGIAPAALAVGFIWLRLARRSPLRTPDP